MRRKCLSILVMMFIVLASFPAASFAETSESRRIEGELYREARGMETVCIDNKLYQYSYYSSPTTGDKAIAVKDVAAGVTDFVTIKDNTVYLNGEAVGSIEDVNENEALYNGATPFKAAGTWKYLGGKSKRVTWAKGTARAIVAAIIAGALSYAATASAVIAATGATVMGILASQTTGGTVTYKVYSRTAGKLTNYKWVWSFKASTGDKYGPYTSYTSV